MKNNVFKKNVNTARWFKAAGIRAIKTFCQSITVMIPTAVMITDVDWKVVLGTSACAALLSFATSVVGIPEVNPEEEE